MCDLRVVALRHHCVDRAVPVRVMLKHRRRAHDVRVGVLRTQRADEVGVPRAPMRRGLAGVVARHEIAGVRIVLSERDDDDVRLILAEIPHDRLAERGIVRRAVPDALHTDVVGRIEPADAVEQRRAALRDDAQVRAELAGGDRAVRIPRVAVARQIHVRVGLARVQHRLVALAAAHRIAVDLDAALARWLCGPGDTRIVVDEHAGELKIMHAAVLAFEHDRLMLDRGQVVGDREREHIGLRVFGAARGHARLGGAGDAHAVLRVVNDHAEADVAVIPMVAQAYGERAAGEAEARLRVRVDPQLVAVRGGCDAALRAQ